MKKYNIGLDIGTESVGWALVECDNQKVLRKGNKKLWGVRLFDGASTAEERRKFRSTRRRYDRRRERIKLLQEEFKEEIDKVDGSFYLKLRESKFRDDDRLNKTTFIEESEKKQIIAYNKKYKTIYHLRKQLVESDEKMDIRLVYLAIHHIIKYRGNFLYNVSNFNLQNISLTDKIYELFTSISNNVFQLENIVETIDSAEIESILLKENKIDIKIGLKDYLDTITDDKKFISEFTKAISGNKFSLKKLFMLEDNNEDISISLSGSDFDDKYSEIEAYLDNNIEVLSIMKELYDILFLKRLFKNSSSLNISSLMVEKYNQHKKDLKFLKEFFKSNKKIYYELFKSKNGEKCIYEKYLSNSLTIEDFYTKINKYFSEIENTNIDNELLKEYETDVKNRILNDSFLPRVTSVDNGKYPYQLNKDELIKIIENQGKYYSFLNEKIDDTYKLVKLLEFKIPYYVGPLVSNKRSKFAWMERKVDNVKITPYNFDEVIDKEKTAELFIKRMISHCSYLLNEYALPNNSILYSKYKVLNELKQIKLNGDKIGIKEQHMILENLFMKESGTITNNKFKNFLYSCPEFHMYNYNINVTGYSADGKFANNMQSYIDFFGENGFFKNTNYSVDNAENIIEWITIFEDKDILKNKIIKEFPNLDETIVNKIIKKKYKGWGNLSKKLLLHPYYFDKKDNVNKSIMDLMYETNENFMQIINNDKYKFQNFISENNVVSNSSKIDYDLVENLATSVSTKKGIYQSLKVVDEIISYMGYEPQNIVLEMAREDGKKQRTQDRKKYLLNIYNNLKEDIENHNKLIGELEEYEKIDTDKLYLYFIQEGKCLYTGEPIDIEDLNTEKYEIDHILPRSLIKDNSINNKALVTREANQLKGASLVLPQSFRTKCVAWWIKLKANGLISAKKFDRLIRKEYKDGDIEDFINRQLVETRQITKHVANILKSLYLKTNIIYLKASITHDYRMSKELFKYRNLNDYHHAHDAYLAAVLGEYKEKFLYKNIDANYFYELNKELWNCGEYKNKKYGYVINSLDEKFSHLLLKYSKDFVDNNTGEVKFNPVMFNKVVKDTLYRNDILVSRKIEIRTGKLFKETIYSKGVGKVQLKKNMPVDWYGGYSNVEPSYMMLIKYKENKYKIIGITTKLLLNNDKKLLDDHIREQLNLKENENYEIIKEKIPFDILLHYKGQDVYIKGYSVSNKNSEVSNAFELNLSKEHQIRWKYVLNKLFNDVEIPIVDNNKVINDELELKILLEIIDFLYNLVDKYPLFKNEIIKIKNTLNINDLDKKELYKILKQIFIIYSCKSKNANLKEFGLGDRIGRLSGNSITSGTLIYKSVTGIKQDEFSFGE